MSNNYSMTCLAGNSASSYGGGLQKSDDVEQARKVAEMAATRRNFLLARIRWQLEEERTEAREFQDAEISDEAIGACARVAEDLLRSLVWRDTLKISGSSTHQGGASLMLTNKDSSKRLTIQIDRDGRAARVIRIGADNVAETDPYDSRQAAEYVKWFF